MNRLIGLVAFFISFSSFSFSQVETICSENDCYTLTKKLGEGAFGNVYQAENAAGMKFAIKCYKSALESSLTEHLLAGQEREFERGQLFNHPHIIKSFDLFEVEGKTTYLVLELVEGKSVNETIKESLSLDQSILAARDFVDALRYALSLGYLHLDLHSENVMLDCDAHPKVIDLASFYSQEEVNEYLRPKKHSSTSTIEAAFNMHSKANQVLQRNLKLQKFFEAHPQLYKDLKEISLKKCLMAKNSDLSEDNTDSMLEPLQVFYFDSVTEMCACFISKSNLSRQERFMLRSKIKWLAWSFQEDAEDGEASSLESYLDQLSQFFKSY